MLDKSVKENRLAEAYLFCGPENVGKKKVALYLAGKILGEEAVEKNPDFVFLEPEILEKNNAVKKGEIKIENIRELQRNLSLSSFGKKGKVAVIDGADRMNVSSQNALLKMLEEPNAKTTIILISDDEKKILPTIKSRCRKIKFGLASDEEMGKMIPESAKNKGEIIFWSLGRPGVAEKLLSDEKELNFMRETFEDFKKLFSGHLFEKFILAEKLSLDTSSLLKKLNIWSALLRQPMLGKNDKIKISSQKSLKLLEEMEKSAERIKNSNANARLVLENLFLSF